MNKFIDHATMISEKKRKYQFITANTDSPSKQETHWWSITLVNIRFNLNACKNLSKKSLML